MKKKARRILKYSLVLIFSLFIIITSGASLFVYFYPEEEVLKIIKKQSTKALKRPVEIDSIKYTLKGISLSGIKIYESSDKSEKKLLLTTDEAIITFSLFSLLSDEIDIWSLYFKGMKINWTFNKDWAENTQNITKDISATKSAKSNSNQNPKINLSRIVLEDCLLNIIKLPDKLKPLEGEYRINSNINVKKNKEFNISNTEITLPHQRGTLFPKLSINTNKKFTAKGTIRLQKCNLAWTTKFSKNSHLSLPFETVNASIDDFQLTTSGVGGRVDGTSTLKNTPKKLQVDGWSYVKFNNLNIAISKVKGEIEDTTFYLNSLKIDGNNGKIQQFDASEISANFTDLKGLVPFFPSEVYGKVKGNMSYNGKNYNGNLKLINCGIKTKRDLVSNFSTDIEIKNNNLKKENISLKLLNNDCKISIATLDNNFQNFYVFLQSEKLNLNNLNTEKKEKKEKITKKKSSSKSINLPISLSGKIVVNEIIYGKYTFNETNIDYSATGNIIKINRFNTTILNGNVFGDIELNFSKKIPIARTSIKFEDIKLSDIKFVNNNLKERFFGFASGSANLNFNISDNLKDTLKGRTIFNITKGKVVNTGVQKGLIFFLADLKYKLKNLEFNKIYGNIDINGENLRSNSFIFNSEDVRLSLTGKINTSLTATNMFMKLEFNNHFIKDIPRPAIAILNKYATGKWYVVPFNINGKITDSKNIRIVDKK